MKKTSKNNIEDILDILQKFLDINGHPFLVKLFEKYKKDTDLLYKQLKKYLDGLYVDVRENIENEEDEETHKKGEFVSAFIYINGFVIDYRNIARVELDSNYNSKKMKMDFFIRIVKKYPSPLEEEYIIPFESEEERDKGFEILKGKLKIAELNII